MKCEYCLKEHDGSFASGRFCSRICSRGFSTKKNRDRISKQVSEKLTQTIKICKVCGQPASRRNGGTGIYCFTHKKKYRNETFEQCGTTIARKRFLIKEQGHHCWECKRTEWRGQPIPLQLDHIDGDPSNDSRENLRIICPNCHAQTSTYCGRNVGRVAFKRPRVRL